MSARKGTRTVAAVLVIGLLLSAGLAGCVSFYASGHPDGLERVAQDQGFADAAEDSATQDSIVADYELGDDGGRLSVATAGLIGIGITALAAFTLFALIKPRAGAEEA